MAPHVTSLSLINNVSFEVRLWGQLRLQARIVDLNDQRANPKLRHLQKLHSHPTLPRQFLYGNLTP